MVESHAFLLDGLGCDALTFKGGNGANFPREIIRDCEENVVHGVKGYLTQILKITRMDFKCFYSVWEPVPFSPALSSGFLEKGSGYNYLKKGPAPSK